MPNPIDVGTATAISFQNSGFNAYILDVGGPSMSREAVDTTHMGTATAKTYMPGDLVDNGEVSLSVAFDPDLTPPVLNAAETIVITWPKPAGKSTAATWSFSGFVTGYEPSAPLEDKMTASLRIKVSGVITRVASA